MKTLCGFIGWIVGMFLGFTVANSVPILSIALIIGGIPIGRYIGGLIEDDREKNRRIQNELAHKRQQEKYEQERKDQRRREAISLARKYPEATKHYFKIHWGITKSTISNYDISDDKVETLLGHKGTYEKDEITYNPVYKAKIEAVERERHRKEEERKEAIRQAEIARLKAEEEERKRLPQTLMGCVSDWYTHSHNSTIKHKWFVNYYPYSRYKDSATPTMLADWKLVWNFKNDNRISQHDHSMALQRVIRLVEEALKNSFGNKVAKLTLVCLAASTADSTNRRYAEFSKRLCSNLGMENGFEHIKIIEDAVPKHLGGNGKPWKQYDEWFFKGKFIILFDDVRTSGLSLEQEKQTIESMGAKVIGAITIAQTQS